MEGSVQFMLWKSSIYGLGALGLFSIGALPLRTYMIVRQLKSKSQPSWLLAAILAIALCAAALSSQFLIQVAKCLLGYHCSANIAGGWINAGFLGVIYVCFELLCFVVIWVSRRKRVAT